MRFERAECYEEDLFGSRTSGVFWVIDLYTECSGSIWSRSVD